MQTGLFISTLIAAGLNWAAAERSWRMVEIISKPATLLALLAWFTFSAGWEGAHLWFGLGLVFSLLGDSFLLFERLFLPGLASFALAQLSYVIGFNQEALPEPLWILFCLAVILLVDSRLFPRYFNSPECQKMKLPVAVYSLVISLMVLSAMLCLMRPKWSLAGSGLATAGAWLFFISDNVLANNRFCKPIRHGGLLVMSTYHLGQIAIIGGVILQ